MAADDSPSDLNMVISTPQSYSGTAGSVPPSFDVFLQLLEVRGAHQHGFPFRRRGALDWTRVDDLIIDQHDAGAERDAIANCSVESSWNSHQDDRSLVCALRLDNLNFSH